MGVYSHYKFDRLLLFKGLWLIGLSKIEPTKIAIKIAEFVYFCLATSKFFFYLQMMKRTSGKVVSIVENNLTLNVSVTKFENQELIDYLEPQT